MRKNLHWGRISKIHFFPRRASEKRVWEANCNNGLCNIYQEGGWKMRLSKSKCPPRPKKGKLSSDPPPDHLENVIKTLFTFTCSLRSKRFRLVSEQRKTSFGRLRNETRAKKWKSGEREGKEGNFLPHPLPALLLAPFFAQSLTLVPLSLLLNPTETLATQANLREPISFLL